MEKTLELQSKFLLEFYSLERSQSVQSVLAESFTFADEVEIGLPDGSTVFANLTSTSHSLWNLLQGRIPRLERPSQLKGPSTVFSRAEQWGEVHCDLGSFGQGMSNFLPGVSFFSVVLNARVVRVEIRDEANIGVATFDLAEAAANPGLALEIAEAMKWGNPPNLVTVTPLSGHR
jgi:hypothetical protein